MLAWECRSVLQSRSAWACMWELALGLASRSAQALACRSGLESTLARVSMWAQAWASMLVPESKWARSWVSVALRSIL